MMKKIKEVLKIVLRLINVSLVPFNFELRRRSKPLPPRPSVPIPAIVARVQDEIAGLCPHPNYAGHYRNFEYAFWSALLPIFWCYLKGAKRHRVLDIGCGYGTLLAVLHELGWEVHGTDMLPLTELMGTQTQERFNISFRPSNIEVADLPYKDDEFDVVIMSEIIEHFHFQPQTSLRRALRVVKPGGFLFVTTPALGFGWEEEEYTQQFEEIPEYGEGARDINPHKHMKIYSIDEFERLINTCGGREVLVDVHTSPHKAQAHCIGFVWK